MPQTPASAQFGGQNGVRARDRLGRPVPEMSAERVDPGVDVDADRTSDDTVIVAQLLVARGLPFAAHEVFEARWKKCPSNERDLWQGLAQWCVAITHAERGNQIGARSLRARSLAHLVTADARRAARHLELDVEPVVSWLNAPTAALPTIVLHSGRSVDGHDVQEPVSTAVEALTPREASSATSATVRAYPVSGSSVEAANTTPST